jgi:hypothetical protein
MARPIKPSLLLLLPFINVSLGALSGQFNILSFNVAGLPAILNSNDVPGDKTTNTEIIGERFAEYGYDIIHVQEVRPSLLQNLSII